jgi:hypothetical protein
LTIDQFHEVKETIEQGDPMILTGEGYSIEFNSALRRIEIIGQLRLNSINKYDDIVTFLLEKTTGSDDELILDLTGLEIMNSSGIASLSLYLIKAKELKRKIRILASKKIHWQALSMEDFEDINENIAVEYVTHH